MDAKFDVIVIGGGPSGATAALMLARADWSVAVVEKYKFPRRKVCGEYLSATNYPLLDLLGVADEFLELAGPEIRKVGLFAGQEMVVCDMPRLGEGSNLWGRALGREHLDTLLLQRAEEAGATIWQPWSAAGLWQEEDERVCTIVSKETQETKILRSPMIIAAHGSWDAGPLPSQGGRQRALGSDLFGFKAHFLDCNLPSGLMPLIAFSGGYGGLVHTDNGRVSFSCCLRRDQLERSRRAWPHARAAEAACAHIQESCRGVREALTGAKLEGAWLSAGPIQPGIRLQRADGIFRVGNAAGEAHPIIAEGISMAMQSAWLLCERLIRWKKNARSTETLNALRLDYVRSWRRHFLSRVYAAAAVAHLAMRPAAGSLTLPLIKVFPAILKSGARLSGKVKRIIPFQRKLSMAFPP